MRMLRRLPKIFDGRMASSSLSDYLMDEFDITTAADIVEMFEHLYNNRSEVAQLAITINDYAKQGDFHALEIIDEGIRELMKMVHQVAKKLSFTHPVVSINGSLGTKEGVYKNRLFEALNKAGYKVSVLKHDAAYGAAKLALAIQNC